jgi:non-lysosomal glucosylceramidase
VRGLRDRHDGERRNPWNEFECGNHYARAMASWSLLLALSGFQYSAPASQIAFAPAVNAGRFRCFFSAGSGWGSFAQQSGDGAFVASLELRAGSLRLERIALRPSVPPTQASVALNGVALAAHVEQAESGVLVVLDQPVVLNEGEMLEIQLL